MKKIRKFIRLLCLLALLAAALWWGNSSLQTETFTYSSAHLPESFDGYRIVQLSDLHGKSFGQDNEQLAAAVAAAQPDLIALTGDFVDRLGAVEDALPLIRQLVEIAPCYYVTGNHEWGGRKAEETISAFRAAGVTCLTNEYVTIARGAEKLVIAGVDDPNGYADQKTPAELAAEISAEQGDVYWLLLAHRNDLFSSVYAPLGADLTLSGHGHGGIWRLPFTDGVFGTDRRLFPSYTSGFYRCETDAGESTLFVSRGLGNSPRIVPRIFNRPQVAVITLKRET